MTMYMQCKGLKKGLVTHFISFNISGLSDGRYKTKSNR